MILFKNTFKNLKIISCLLIFLTFYDNPHSYSRCLFPNSLFINLFMHNVQNGQKSLKFLRSEHPQDF